MHCRCGGRCTHECTRERRGRLPLFHRYCGEDQLLMGSFWKWNAVTGRWPRNEKRVQSQKGQLPPTHTRTKHGNEGCTHRNSSAHVYSSIKTAVVTDIARSRGRLCCCALASLILPAPAPTPLLLPPSFPLFFRGWRETARPHECGGSARKT